MHILDEFELLALVVALQLRPLVVIVAASRNLATRLLIVVVAHVADVWRADAPTPAAIL